jgi:hypothetical protein
MPVLFRLVAAAIVLVGAGCNSQPPLAQISGKVTFKGQPVPAGFISFTPDSAAGTLGHVRALQVKDGAYDSAKESEPGLPPGKYFIRISGFDGVRIPLYGQGKQIFNEIEDTFTVPEGESTKDWEIPDSAGENVLIQPTADT